MGVLDGIKVVEIASARPSTFCGMFLADLGAEVTTIERPAADAGQPRPWEICNRGKRSMILNLKQPEAVDAVLKLIEGADALIEGMRPGVMERLGLGPDVCLARRPCLVYGRLTGWGQSGPLSHAAGYDSTFAAVSGATWVSTQAGERPEPPLGLLAGVGGGALYLTFGLLAALFRARVDGHGQVVDAAMVDGAANMLNLMLSLIIPYRGGSFELARPNSYGKFYARSYRCADGEWIRLEADEPHFYAELIKCLGLDEDERFVRAQQHPEAWQALSAELDSLFATKTRNEWCELFKGTDACFAAILSPPEAAVHPHNAERGIYTTVDGVLQAVAAPRFSAIPLSGPARVPARGTHTNSVLSELGFTSQQLEELTKSGALG
ncbi:CoA transferase [Bradyrhizobium diazoefficiens]|uniref:CaiB/BaiF CoA transferase family protein n=1 Tax=Bradyrhizobium diazoefficiens TaxID=1355477 RepID=UPI001909CD15|nr:CaiB/BaiF CoA-transferase family protein [Bradyrhizobium diazoefficiens]QQO35578.1 CoA transferase [Bradyrhizobium diazoefficiens]